VEELSEQSIQRPQYVEVYGADHSPWVQAVLLGLHEAGIRHDLRTTPTRDVFIARGVRMPAASIDGGPWKFESTDILADLGFDGISDSKRRLVVRSWQGVTHRPDSAAMFWGGFSLTGDRHKSAPRRFVRNFLRSFVTLYMYLLIKTVNRLGYMPDAEDYGGQYLPIEGMLERSDGPFVAGKAPDTIDFLLFGIVQCHCSIYVPPVAALQADPRLVRVRAWIGAMQERFSDYPHLYSGLYFAPHSPPPVWPAPVDRIAFWLGSLFMIGLFPITVPLIAFLAVRERRVS
jgi:hypothetical protein